MTALVSKELLHRNGSFCDRNVSQGLVVLAIFARCASELPPEFARKVALIREAAFQRDPGQRFIRVHQDATRNTQAQFSQKLLRGQMKGSTELPFERTERHVRNRRQLT